MESFAIGAANDRKKSEPKKTDTLRKEKSEKILHASQRTDLKEALKEGLLIARGDIEGSPLSDLWDE